MPLASFDTPWKHQKTFGFLMFSGGIEGDQWHESIYFNGKKPFRSNTIETSTIVITKRCRKNQDQDLISFGQMMKYSFFFHLLSNSNFCCYCSRSALSISCPFEGYSMHEKIKWIHKNYNLILFFTSSMFSLLSKNIFLINTRLCSHQRHCTENHFIADIVSLSAT